MGIRLLGNLEVVDGDGEALDIGGAQARVILAMLVAADGRVVGVDALIDAVWEESPPLSADGTLQTYVSRLRRVLAAVGGSIVRTPGGYRLDVARELVDVHRFEALTEEGRALLDAGDPVGARRVLVEADDLWRGPALLEIRDRPRISGIARRLDDRRLAALENRIAADLAAGRHGEVVAELAQHVGDHPLREELWELLALARYRSGRQAEALRAIADARATLVESLGVEPGPRLRDLERAILAHDPSLEWISSAPAPIVERDAPARSAAHAAAMPTPAARGRPPIVGRDDELARLRRAFDQVVDGGVRVVVVQGEAGVGKTRLVEELATTATESGARVVWGRALEGDVTPAFWPWLGVLRSLRGVDPGRSNAAVDQLLDASGVDVDKPALGDLSMLLDGVLALVEAPPDAGPLVVILEDVQWADAESLALAAHVTSELNASRVMVILTMRDEGDADRAEVVGLLASVSRRPDTCRLHVDGLEPAATAQLLAHVSARPVDEGLAAAVHHRVDGNPFYAIELQQLLDAEGLDDASSVDRVAVPVGVRDVVRRRLGRLPQQTLELLRLAAVAGREIDVALISVACGRSIDDCLDDIDVALEHRLLTDAGPHAGLRFAHALVREVLADDLSTLRRARLHLMIADALESEGSGTQGVEIVAEHLWASVPIGDGGRAADALDRAADVAIRRFAVGASCDLLDRSLGLRRQRGDAVAELDTLVMLVWSLRASGGYQAGLAHYARGAELARQVGRPDVELEMQWGEWAGYSTSCDFDRGRPVARRFRDRALSSDDPLTRFAGLTAWAIQCWHDGNLVEASAMFDRAAAVRASLGDDFGHLSFWAELGVLATGFGLYLGEHLGTLDDPDGAFRAAAAAVDGNVPSAIVWSFGCTSAVAAGDLERVDRYTAHVLDAEAGETLGFWGSQARMYRGAMLIATGNEALGRELFETGERAYVASGMRTGLTLMLAAAASAEVIAGDVDRARRHLDAAQRELDGGERWPGPFVLLAEADIAEASSAAPAEVANLRTRAASMATAQGAVVAAALAEAAIAGHRWSDRRPQRRLGLAAASPA